MMQLSDVRDMVAEYGIAEDEHCYCGKLQGNLTEAIGAYPLKSGHPYRRAIGGAESYHRKDISFLVHWSKSCGDTEEKSNALFDALKNTRNQTINGILVLFIIPTYDEPIPIGTDDAGIYEYVIECSIYYTESED